MRFLPEPSPPADHPTRTGLLLVNLGTPDAPTPGAVRRYLAEFLSDPRVVEIPRALWLPILYGFVLTFRPRDAAGRYASIWMPEGSPLLVWSRRQSESLARELAHRGLGVEVALAMRYGKPSIAAALDSLRESGCQRILVLPLYPQYSASTTASVFDAVGAHLARVRNAPEIRYVRDFHDDAGYIEAMAVRILDFWGRNGRGQKLLLSFHGLPKRSTTLGDPYYEQCLQTGRLLAGRLGLYPEQMEVTFQSRFGAAEWLQPYTEPRLKELAKDGVTEVDVFCPGFAADCIETLEEIAVEGKEAFLLAGGRQLRYIPALNDADGWVKALADLAERNMQGWATRVAGSRPAAVTQQTGGEAVAGMAPSAEGD
ncbi:MAG: ferrochelatase [Pigmentiphaga sp.]|uniref:ferrochelatase n=1 Tax=Pigmentiphaga sp. TaxID=1977564 RepID=UPI0029AA553C|nr:ferrochelatase [Pigmentiphaga sp.]MDX3904093.1 ferrochelatase [Pigmentiphaga sp.]